MSDPLPSLPPHIAIWYCARLLSDLYGDVDPIYYATLLDAVLKVPSPDLLPGPGLRDE